MVSATHLLLVLWYYIYPIYRTVLTLHVCKTVEFTPGLHFRYSCSDLVVDGRRVVYMLFAIMMPTMYIVHALESDWKKIEPSYLYIGLGTQ